jgi:hypothetical protein
VHSYDGRCAPSAFPRTATDRPRQRRFSGLTVAAGSGVQSGVPTGPAGTFRQRTEISPAQAGILDKLGIDPPPGIYRLIPAVSR